MVESRKLLKNLLKKQKRPILNVMISEGTRIDNPSTETEEDIEINAKNLIAGFNGSGYCQFSCKRS